MTKRDQPQFEEFSEYLLNISFQKLLTDKSYISASKPFHKRVLALMIVEYQLEILLRKSSDELVRASIPFLNEFRSDILSSLLIFQFGMYKPANMTGRSSIENFFRVVAALSGKDFRHTKSVHDLIELLKATSRRSSNKYYGNSLETLISIYGELCNYVHSNGEDYLTKDRKLGEIPRWEEKSGKWTGNTLTKAIQSELIILLIINPQILVELHHKQKDYVLDALPMSAKASLLI